MSTRFLAVPAAGERHATTRPPALQLVRNGRGAGATGALAQSPRWSAVRLPRSQADKSANWPGAEGAEVAERRQRSGACMAIARQGADRVESPLPAAANRPAHPVAGGGSPAGFPPAKLLFLVISKRLQ